MDRITERVILIAKYLKYLNKCEKIQKYLFENTELFEEYYTDDFQTELFRFFSGKIGRFAREYNKLMIIMNERDVKKLKKIEVTEDI